MWLLMYFEWLLGYLLAPDISAHPCLSEMLVSKCKSMQVYGIFFFLLFHCYPGKDHKSSCLKKIAHRFSLIAQTLQV